MDGSSTKKHASYSAPRHTPCITVGQIVEAWLSDEVESATSYAKFADEAYRTAQSEYTTNQLAYATHQLQALMRLVKVVPVRFNEMVISPNNLHVRLLQAIEDFALWQTELVSRGGQASVTVRQSGS